MGLSKQLRKIFRKYRKQNLFKGHYTRLEDIGVTGYSETENYEAARRVTEKKLSHSFGPDQLPNADVTGNEANLLPLLVSLLALHQKRVTVLDFGGALGWAYIDCLNCMPDASMLDYHVVELPETSRVGAEYFTGNEFVTFHNKLPDLPRIDIVHICSTLQYISDYSDLLRQLADRHPQYIFLVNHFVGAMPTYATAQMNIKNHLLARWIFSFDELCAIMAKNDFKLIYKSANKQSWGEWTFGDVPEGCKVEHRSHLLFAANASPGGTSG